jgi:alcohol dehydrogenase YqhD (iron-dependent ADH family)
MHAIEHALSAYYDITHGLGLAIITPRWMRHILSEKTLPRFVKFGVNVLGIDSTLPDMDIANKSIDMMYEFFEGIGIPMHLSEVGIPDGSRIGEMAHHVATTQPLTDAWAPLTEADIAAIMQDSL